MGGFDIGAQTDTFVKQTLAAVQSRLARQVFLGLRLSAMAEADAQARASEIATRFISRLVTLRDLHDTNIAAA